MTEERFNLIDEPWIPVANRGLVSLKDIFADSTLGNLGGNARQKIALLKLFLAIAQAAATPKDDAEWKNMGPEGMGQKCLSYLENNHSSFFLYGPKPFMQMPVEKAKKFPYAALQPEIASGNNPRLFHMQCEQPLSDAEKALVFITEVNMGLGGKTVDRSFSLADGLQKGSAAASPGMGFQGYLHSFLTGKSLLKTIWFNLVSADTISGWINIPEGLCPPPWEEMPKSENDSRAIRLTNSFNGRLTPMCRFCLLDADAVHFTEGIIHPSHKAGRWDPSVAARMEKGEYKMLWADPEKRPWRSLTALLAVINTNRNDTWSCIYLKDGIERILSRSKGEFGIWSGGLKVSSNSGQQYLAGSDDTVESETILDSAYFDDANWFPYLETSMSWLEKVSQILYSSVYRYFKESSVEKSDHPAQACSVFWEQAESLWQPLIVACQEPAQLPDIYKRLRTIAINAYDFFCPRESAKQIKSWAKCFPKIKLPQIQTESQDV